MSKSGNGAPGRDSDIERAPKGMIPDDAKCKAARGRLKQLAEDGKVSRVLVALAPEAGRLERVG